MTFRAFYQIYISTRWYWNISCVLVHLSDSTIRTSIFAQLSIYKNYRPKTSFIFLLIGVGFFLMFFDIYPIISHTPVFLHSFLFIVTVVQCLSMKHLSIPWYWNFSCVILYLSDSTSHTSIFRLFPISSDVCKGYRPETSVIFLLLGAGIFLCYSISIRQYHTHQHFCRVLVREVES